MNLANQSLKVKVALGCCLPVVLLVALSVTAHMRINSLRDTNQRVKHTYEVIENARAIGKTIIDLETGERGFLLTGKDEFLEPFNAGKTALVKLSSDTKELVDDNPAQVERLKRIDALVGEWLQKAAGPEIDLRGQVVEGAKDAGYLQEVLGASVGKGILDETRDVLDELYEAFEDSHNYNCSKLVLSIAKDLADMETGQRGFLITGRDEFLEPYQQGQKALATHIATLRQIVSSAYDRTAMKSDLARVVKLTEQWQRDAAQPEIKLREAVREGTGDFSEIERVLSAATGKGILDSLRRELATLDDTFQKAKNEHKSKLVLSIAKDLVDMETGQRGFLITGKDEFLEPYNQGLSSLKSHLDELQAEFDETYDLFETHRRIDRVEALSDSWLEKAAGPEIAARVEMNENTASMKDVVALIEAKTGKAIIDSIRVELRTFVGVEEKLLVERENEAAATTQRTSLVLTGGTVVAIVLALVLAVFITRSVVGPLQSMVEGTRRLAAGEVIEKFALVQRDEMGVLMESINAIVVANQEVEEVAAALASGDYTRVMEKRGDKDTLVESINVMSRKLGQKTKENKREAWLKTGQTELLEKMRGEQTLDELAGGVLTQLATYLGAQVGVLYVSNDDDSLRLTASYAFTRRKNLSDVIQTGEGIVGQAVLEKKPIIVKNVPEDYMHVNSALGEALPRNVIAVPFISDGAPKGAIELGSFDPFSDTQLELLTLVAENIAIAIRSGDERARTKELLEESQAMSEELQTQQEELQQSNEELEEKAKQLAEQNVEAEEKNREVEEAKQSLQEKAEQLALTSKYKSEFLANMSHELRTPLNSLMILSKALSDNADRNLTNKQIEYASTIHTSGADLLELINEILDLSKIESGTMAVEMADMPFSDLQAFVERTFRQMAEDKECDFAVDLDLDLPQAVHTDTKRLQQVLKNLLSNALKFTEKGRVGLRISPALQGWSCDHETLDRASRVIAFAVSDTGVGIPKDKQKVIFEAFQQADGGASRKYGGTGLGLSISREIARLLGGEIRVESTPGKGSTFTLYLPQGYTPLPKTAPLPQNPVEGPPQRLIRDSQSTGAGPTVGESDLTSLVSGELPDDRDDIQPGDHVVLIVEDDVKFARILLDMAHDKGFKRLVATRGDAGLALARKYKPDAITLDIRLPGSDGWRVLDQLKHEPATRHIPVHVISVEDGRQRALHQGAIAYLEKPADEAALSKAFADIGEFVRQRVKKLLIVEDDETQRKAIIELIGNSDVETTAVGTGQVALEAMKSTAFDCLVLDLGLPDMSGFELIEAIKRAPDIREIPIIVYTGKELTEQEETRLKHVAESIIVKDVKSPERLLDETALFLHRVEENLPERNRKMLRQIHQQDPALAGKKILVVDDDMRNIFALTAVLEGQKMDVIYAETGQAGLQMLKDTPDVDVVLMDIMMPGIDGYATMRAIRKMPQFKKLPIIAVTAKAMKGDREKCIEAGASDYIKKPVDTEQLLSLLRVWTYG